jgi:hypothetical protein
VQSGGFAGGTSGHTETDGNLLDLSLWQLTPMGDAVISLRRFQRLAAVGCHTLLTVLHFREHSSNPTVTCICVNNESFSCLRLRKNGAAHRATFSLTKAACASEVHWKDRLCSVSFVSGFAISSKPEINRL